MSNPTSLDPDALLSCGFCGKDQTEVRKLIAGPKVCICNECVDVCNDILKSEISEPIEITTADAAALRQAYEDESLNK